MRAVVCAELGPGDGEKLRLDPDLLQALRNSGDGWQTRVNDALRAKFLNE